MTPEKQLHEALTAGGLPVVSVRVTARGLEPVLEGRATDGQKEEARRMAKAFVFVPPAAPLAVEELLDFLVEEKLIPAEKASALKRRQKEKR